MGSVLLEGLFSWGCGENGSSKAGKVSEFWLRVMVIVLLLHVLVKLCLLLGFMSN